MMTHSFPSDREVLLTRTINAPRERVFAAWTAPNVDAWWGPNGFVTTTSSRDVRVGGEWHFVMRHAQYGEFVNRVRFLEIDAPNRIHVHHDGGEKDTSGGFHMTATFVDRGDRTDVTLHHVLASAEALEKAKQYGAVEGGFQTLARLEGSLT